MTRLVRAGGIRLGGKAPLVLIAGPCIIEDKKKTVSIARYLKRLTGELGIPLIFKSSYDKANRSSHRSYRGPGIKKGLDILLKVKEEVEVPVLSDIHCREEADKAAKVLDVIQVPAYLSRQTDLIFAAADTGLPVNIKKGQFLSPYEMVNVINKITSRGNNKIILTERGTSFGYGNLVADMRSLVVLKELGYPVVFDATHSVQLPGGLGSASGGEKKFVFPLARAAVAVGVDGLFVEVHPDPDNAPCDGPNSLKLNSLKKILKKILDIDQTARA